MLNIAMISEHASPLAVLGGVDAGGQNVHVAALAEALGRQGASVTVYTRRDDPALPVRVPYSANVTVEHVDAGPAQPVEKDRMFEYMPAFAQVLKAKWRESPPDVVHAHFWMSGSVALEAAKPLEVPFVQTFHALGVEKRRHQGEKDTSPPERLACERRIARNADRIVATASAEAFELVRMGATSSAISVVPCGVDLEHFTPVGETEKRRGHSRRVVCLSRMVERKGIGDTIVAMRALAGTELIVAGGPERKALLQDPEGRRLTELTRALHIEDRVKFRGRIAREEVPALLRSADAVVCYPWYEPFGIVPLEAMACGVPVVVSRVGGLVDSVVDGITGVHVAPHQPEALADALRDLLADRGRCARLGLAGARRMHQRYGWARIASDTLAVYNDVIIERAFARRAS